MTNCPIVKIYDNERGRERLVRDGERGGDCLENHLEYSENFFRILTI